jgi:hypothetical protein
MNLTPGCTTEQVLTPAEIIRMEPESRDLFAAFSHIYEEIKTRVQEGTLPAAVGAKADELKMELEKYLIKIEAELHILQVDVLYGADDQREAALKEVVVLAAERERTKMAYLQRLQALNTSHLSGEKTKRNGKFKEIEIEIGPENVDSGTP